MTTIISKQQSEQFLTECRMRRNLSEKTIKAYRIDLTQFLAFLKEGECNQKVINDYLDVLMKRYQKIKTIKRKIATLKSFFHYLRDVQEVEDFSFVLQFSMKEPKVLPKIISQQHMKRIFELLYDKIASSTTLYERKLAIRNAAMIEFLYATGIRISELCNLRQKDIDLEQKTVIIYGKGAKERFLQIGNSEVLQILQEYQAAFSSSLQKSAFFFLNRQGNRLSEQSVRCLLSSIEKQLAFSQHITPHMLRHTFATQLLEEDVDIRYIQRILGHSSITTTEIYTHVTSSKQKEILINKNPRNQIVIHKT